MNGVCDTSHYPKEGPWVLPEGWVWCRIDEMGEVVTGTTPSKSDTSNYGSDYPFYKPTDLECGLSTSTAGDNLSAKGFERTRQLPINSVLVTCIGATIGKTGLIRKAGSCNQQINAIIPYASLIDPEYLYYCCASGYGQDTIISRASATTLPILNKSKFSEILFPLPPFSEQHRILRVIQKYLVIIGTIESENTELDKLIQTSKDKILELAIHGKLVPQYSTDEPAIETLKRINPAFKPSDNLHYEGELPKGWCFSTIGELFQHNTGKALNSVSTKGKELRYITTSNLYWDRFELSEVRTMPFTESELDKCRVVKGDLLVCEGGDIGRAAIWPFEESVMIQNHIHRLRPKTKVCVRYFYYLFFLYKRKGLIGGKGIAIQGLSSRELDKMVIPVPPVEEQHRIVQAIEDRFSVLCDIESAC